MIPSCMEYGKYNLYFRIGFAYLSYHICLAIACIDIYSFHFHVRLNLYYNSMYTETINSNANRIQIRLRHYRIPVKCRLKYTIQM